MKKLLPTVTVGLAAYNEEANIKNLLHSIINQKEDGFKLKQILIISDGSTDRTVRIVKSIKNQKIKIIDSEQRLGQPSRLNQIYSLFDSDYLVQTDADAVFGSKYVIKHIVGAFEADQRIAMCGGNVTPISPKNSIQRAVYCSVDIYKKIAPEINHGNNIFTANGPLLAFKKQFVKKIRMPKEMIASDRYMYLICVLLGRKYQFVEKSVAFFELPLTLTDHIKQNIRFKRSKKLLYSHFSINFLRKEFAIPKRIFLKNLILNLVKHPISFIYIFSINRYCKLISSLKNKKNSNILWEKLKRTKVAIN